MAAYAVALFYFMLVLCSTRGLPCPGRSWGQHERLYVRLYAVFMLLAYAKYCIFIVSFTLLILLALCASHLCDECFRFCFMLALRIIFASSF